MTTINPPTTRFSFAHEWDEIGYLADKMEYWLYERDVPRRARTFTTRLSRLLARVDAKEESILGQAGRSLVAESKGDLGSAIRYREREIQRIRRLQEISLGTPGEQVVLDHYGPAELAARLESLALLHLESGNPKKAAQVLTTARDYCRQNTIVFDSEPLLDELLTMTPPSSRRRRLASQVG